MRKSSKKFLLLVQNIVFFVDLIEYCKSSCPKDSPFLKDEVCLSCCTNDEINNKICIIDNEIMKTQFINKINYLSGNGYNYLNMAVTKNQDLLVLISSYPESNDRILFGLTNEGRGYFNEDKKCSITINDRTVTGKFESEIFVFKLLDGTKEYLLSFGKTPQYIEFYDINSKKIINYYPINTFFYQLYDVRQLVGAYFKITTNDKNYYLIGLLSTKYNAQGKGTPTLSLIKFSIKSINTFNNAVTREINANIDVNVYDSRVVSCYELSTFYISCFYKNDKNKYTMGIFSSNLKAETSKELATADKNDLKFFKCAHFFGEIGAFIYYSNNNPPYATIEFKRYSSNKITDAFSKLSFNNYLFQYNVTNNDIIKIFDKKIFFVAVSLDKLKLYVISIYNYDQQKITERIYEINSFLFNGYYFYNVIRLQIFVNYLAFASNGFSDKEESFTALTIFSYPNSTDINNELTEYLFNNNQIKIDNIKLKLRDICNIENNIFGHILTGIKILEIYKTTNHYLALQNGAEIAKNDIIDIDETLKLIIPKTDHIYTEFTYGIKYVCQATEPEYEEYNKYVKESQDTGTSGKENEFFNSQKQEYSGRHSYHYFLLSNILTEEGCDTNCELCYNSNKNKCITCINDDYDILDTNKKCKELLTTPDIIETDISEIKNTIPKLKVTTVPIIEITIPKINVNTNPIIETIIPKIPVTTNPIIETTIPKFIVTTNPKYETFSTIIEATNMPNLVNCTARTIIEGICIGNLTDEMADEIYFYIKKNIINPNFTEDNLIIKTPSVAYQLTSLNYQINNNLNLSIVDLGECEIKIKEENNIPEELDLIIYKIDIQNPDKSLTYVQYEIYHPITFNQLSLDVCQDSLINITVPAELGAETIQFYQSLESQGYNMFDSNNEFYNDICTPYTSIYNTDILLIDRKKDIYSKYSNITICQDKCSLESYNSNSNTVSCYCKAQSNNTDLNLNIQPKFSIQNIGDVFLNYLNNSNFRVLKCYKVAIDLNTIFDNIGRIIMTLILFLFIVLFIIFLIKGNKQISIYTKQIINYKLMNKKENNNNNTKNVGELNNELKSNIKNKYLNGNKFNYLKKKNNIKKFVSKNKISKTTSNPIKNKKIFNKKNNRNNLNSNKLLLKANKKLINSFKSSSPLFSKDKSIINQKSSSNNKLKKIIKNNQNNILVYNFINNYNSNKKESTKKNKAREKAKNLFTDQELNRLDYNKALLYDKRTYAQYYCSLLKRKQLLMFTFLPVLDYNLQYIKIILFLISFSLYFSVNGFFFSDKTIHSIYEDKGLANYLNQIASILYSSIIPSVINAILKLLSLSENDIYLMKQQKDGKNLLKIAKEIEACIKIKFILFFIICYLLLFFFWYFISCFCGVYKNTQIVLITDTFISFGTSMIYPFGLSLLPGIFRIQALRAKNKDKKCLFQISSLVALI